MRSIAHRAIKFLAVTLAAMFLAHCAPNNAEEIRELRPTSLGLLGGMYRPNGHMALGISGGISKASFLSNSDGFSISPSDDDRDAKIKSTASLDPYLHFYPSAASAAFVGVGLSYKSAKYSWKERTTAYTDSTKLYTPIDYEDSALYLHVPLGWAWIWGNGFTLSLDFGPGVRLSHKKSFTTPGTNPDTSRRDDYAKKIENKWYSFGGGSIIGYSF